MHGLSIDEVPIPASLDEDSDGVFEGMMAVRNACEIAAYGIPEVVVSAEEMFPNYRDVHQPHRIVLARTGGRIVGRGIHEYLADEPSTGWLTVQVHPDEVGGGIGGALLDAVEAIAREVGNKRVITYAASADGPGERLIPPTGFGSVPAANREVRFLRDRGWALEQVERGSRYPLPIDRAAIGALRAAAETRSAGYVVQVWIDASAPEDLDDLAVLQTRMTSDAPTAGLGQPIDVWTADRFAELEHRQLENGAISMLTAGVRHVESGRMVGFTRMRIPADPAVAVGQWDTIVLPEHRGHGLGMLLKVANLQELDASFPGHPSVLTWNAEENRHMLDVNEAVGFVPIGYEGAWAKTLS